MQCCMCSATLPVTSERSMPPATSLSQGDCEEDVGHVAILPADVFERLLLSTPEDVEVLQIAGSFLWCHLLGLSNFDDAGDTAGKSDVIQKRLQREVHLIGIAAATHHLFEDAVFQTGQLSRTDVVTSQHVTAEVCIGHRLQRVKPGTASELRKGRVKQELGSLFPELTGHLSREVVDASFVPIHQVLVLAIGHQDFTRCPLIVRPEKLLNKSPLPLSPGDVHLLLVGNGRNATANDPVLHFELKRCKVAGFIDCQLLYLNREVNPVFCEAVAEGRADRYGIAGWKERAIDVEAKHGVDVKRAWFVGSWVFEAGRLGDGVLIPRALQ